MTQITDEMKVAAVKAYTEVDGKCRPAAMQKALEAALPFLPIAVEGKVDPDEEMYQIGVRDGYSQAVQQIDRQTGGDGEYRYCTDHDPERHTPGPAEMIQRIVDRFEVLNLLDDATKTGRDQEWGISSPGKDGGQEPVLFVSEKQLPACIGTYLPTRKNREGNFQMPLYTRPQAASTALVEYRIVFDGFPSPDGPRFIEVENAAGQSINAGEWRKRDDGLCELVIKAGAHAHG